MRQSLASLEDDMTMLLSLRNLSRSVKLVESSNRPESAGDIGVVAFMHSCKSACTHNRHDLVLFSLNMSCQNAQIAQRCDSWQACPHCPSEKESTQRRARVLMDVYCRLPPARGILRFHDSARIESIEGDIEYHRPFRTK